MGETGVAVGVQGDLRGERIVHLAREGRAFAGGQQVGAGAGGAHDLQADAGFIEGLEARLAEIFQLRVDFGPRGGRVWRGIAALDDEGRINPALKLRHGEMFFKGDNAHVPPSFSNCINCLTSPRRGSRLNITA